MHTAYIRTVVPRAGSLNPSLLAFLNVNINSQILSFRESLVIKFMAKYPKTNGVKIT